MNRIILYFFLVLLFSCSSEKKNNYLASYKNEHLLLEEVYDNIPLNISDTNTYISNYINDWLKTKVVYNKAKLYIDEEGQEISLAVNNFKETLLIHKYQMELLDNQFDTTVQKSDIEEYYSQYSDDFILHKDILKARLVVVNKESLNLSKLRSLITTQYEEEIVELQDFCEMYAENSFLNDSVWIYLTEISHKLPTDEKQNNKLISYKNKIHSFTDDNFMYLIFVKDYQIKGKKSPLPFVFNTIREILQNKHKRQFINSLEDKLYKDALSSEHIKIY